MRVAPRNFGLAGIWLVLLVLSWISGSSDSELARRDIGRLFPDFQAAGAERIVIEQPPVGGALAERIEIVRRERNAGEAAWVLPDHFDHPAGKVPLQHLFDALTSLTNLDLLSESAVSHDDYGVGASGLQLRVYGAGGELLVGIVQGSEAASSSGMGLASYVRIMGADEVYRAPRVGRIPSDPRRWLETHWLSFEPGLVREVRVVEGGEREIWTRAEMERWTRDGAPVSARLMRSLLDRLNACFLDDVVDIRPGEREATLEIVIVSHDGSELELYFAEEDPEGSRAAWLGADGTVVRFSASTCARMQKALKALRGGR